MLTGYKPAAADLLVGEARSLLTRLSMLGSFLTNMPSVNAASASPDTNLAIERHLSSSRRKLAKDAREFIAWMKSDDGRRAPPTAARKKLTVIRLRFNAALSQFDIFADALTQRGEHGTGIKLAGLDVAAYDILRLKRQYYEMPPLMCYLERGLGAAIRRVTTRLPGGERSPVTIVHVPRVRLGSINLASSLAHEIGHQGAAFLNLVDSLKSALRGMSEQDREIGPAWILWGRCISEVIADFWSIAKVGVASTRGLMAVLSLPNPFVFKTDINDPHPVPWIRVKLSCAIGDALYPDPQWRILSGIWQDMYPPVGLSRDQRRIIGLLDSSIPSLVKFLIDHRPESLRGDSLKEAMQLDDRRPERLTAMFDRWRESSTTMLRTSPALAFAIIGQARADKRISSDDECRVLDTLLNHWAKRGWLEAAWVCASRVKSGIV